MTHTKKIVQLAILMCCHNRRHLTLRCIDAIRTQSAANLSTKIFLVDDGSTDGTSDFIQAHYPDVNLIQGNGCLYWAGGIRTAWDSAVRIGTYDYFLWLNDDVILDSDAISSALLWAQEGIDNSTLPAIYVGTLRSPTDAKPIYGGRRRPSKWRSLYFDLITSNTGPLPCETCNGNFVLIPSDVTRRIEMIDRIFCHAYADYDFGFRARTAGFPLLVLPGSVGTCAPNPLPKREYITRLPLIERWKRMTSPKRYPFVPWFTFTFRHTGPLWPIYFFRPYVEALFPKLFRVLR